LLKGDVTMTNDQQPALTLPEGLLEGTESRPPASPGDAIVVENIGKRYPNGTEAVQGISFRVRQGDFFGILGPNGAGKSTTIGILGTLVKPTSGRALVGGVDVARHPEHVRPHIGFAMQEVGVDALATGREFLVLQGRLQGLTRATAARRAGVLLDLVGLVDDANKRLGAYSGGMKRRIDLASALIHLPAVLFLDEPTEGLDPRARTLMWGVLRGLNESLGVTVVLTTHYMEEADQLCDRIAIIDRGRIVAEDTPAELKASVGSQSLVLTYGSDAATATLAQARAALLGHPEIQDVVLSSGAVSVYIDDPASFAPEILRVLEREGAPPRALSIRQPTLEDVYLRYTGRNFEYAEGSDAA